MATLDTFIAMLTALSHKKDSLEPRRWVLLTLRKEPDIAGLPQHADILPSCQMNVSSIKEENKYKSYHCLYTCCQHSIT